MPRPQQPERLQLDCVQMYRDGLTVSQIAKVTKLTVACLMKIFVDRRISQSDRGSATFEFWREKYADEKKRVS